MHRKITVVVVDDHRLIATAIANIIDQFDGFSVLYVAEDGKELVDRLQVPKNIPDIVLLDISMPVMDGFETAAWLTQYHSSIKIMALTMHDDDLSLLKMVENGACSYLQKNIHPNELYKVLEAVVHQGQYYPAWATSKLINRIFKNAKKENDLHLSTREKEFLSYVCTDMTYKEIAEKMFCSPRTVESYRDALFEKLEVKSRVALALYSVKSGIFKL